jgi:hypothetical protein
MNDVQETMRMCGERSPYVGRKAMFVTGVGLASGSFKTCSWLIVFISIILILGYFEALEAIYLYDSKTRSNGQKLIVQ